MKNNPIPKLALLLATTAASSHAQVLFSDNFDSNSSANWTVNNNGNGLNAANFFFDYSTVGIPSAPNSTGGTTVGLKLGANLSGTGPVSGVLPGISVSPTGLSLSGDYTLKFDWWHNWLGNASTGLGATGGGSGSTQLSTFGILSSGTVANYAGSADSVFFAATGDGASTTDYRIYSPDKPGSYNVGDAGISYEAGSKNSSASLYTTLFPAGATAPEEQVTLSSTQSGSSLAGTAGFRWHEIEIEKLGFLVSWKINDTLIGTLDLSALTNATSGNNILLGHSDTSLGAGTPANLFEQLDFTLIDNVQVTPVPEPAVGGLLILGAGALALAHRRKN